MSMYHGRPFNNREDKASHDIRAKLEETERMILKIGPCRERSLALTKLDEALLWANVAMAETGVADYEQ